MWFPSDGHGQHVFGFVVVYLHGYKIRTERIQRSWTCLLNIIENKTCVFQDNHTNTAPSRVTCLRADDVYFAREKLAEY